MAISEDAIMENLENALSDIQWLTKTRERSLAITKLQECLMWLKKGRE